ncbi:hypothetical protein HXX76_006757 [Chlamydomonas incerta]|uniref:3'-5' exonuclease domain-containing protein n=1 Tax=Chlamydomonas incerta TaxID=51695 RepID=A0A835W467_CHLIN|nr:hypothetical protein HXX76_006757 [Chlamydomonas incerta]|eukprot:KAG2436454.1 hypothetical protein HXX76_006757 [Chlamydomonas incerta]
MLLHDEEPRPSTGEAQGFTAAEARAEHASSSFVQSVLQHVRHTGAARPHEGEQQHRADADDELEAVQAEWLGREAGGSGPRRPRSRRQQRMAVWLDQDDTLGFDFWGPQPGTATVPRAMAAAAEEVLQPEVALAAASTTIAAALSGRSPGGSIGVRASLQGGGRGGRRPSSGLMLAEAVGQAVWVSTSRGGGGGGRGGNGGSGRSPGKLRSDSRAGALASGAAGNGSTSGGWDGGDAKGSSGGREQAGAGGGAGGGDWRALLADGADRQFLSSLYDPDAQSGGDATDVDIATSYEIGSGGQDDDGTFVEVLSPAFSASLTEELALGNLGRSSGGGGGSSGRSRRRRAQQAQEAGTGRPQERADWEDAEEAPVAAAASRQRGQQQWEFGVQGQAAQDEEPEEDEDGQAAADWRGPRMDASWQQELGWAPGGAVAAPASADGAASAPGEAGSLLGAGDEEDWGVYFDAAAPLQRRDAGSGVGSGMIRGWRDATRGAGGAQGAARTAGAAAARGSAGRGRGQAWDAEDGWSRWEEGGAAPDMLGGNSDWEEPAWSGRAGYLPPSGPTRAPGGGRRGGGKAAVLRAEDELRRNAAIASASIPRKGASVGFWLPAAPAVAAAAAAADAAASPAAAPADGSTPALASAPAPAARARVGAGTAARRQGGRLAASEPDVDSQDEDEDEAASAGTDAEAEEFVREAIDTAVERAATARAAAVAAAAEAESDKALWARIPLQYNFGPIFKILEMDRADSMPQPIPIPPELRQLAEELPCVVLGSGSSSGSKDAGSGSSSADEEGLLRPGSDAREPAAGGAAAAAAADAGPQAKGKAKGKAMSAKQAAAALLSGVTAYVLAGGVEVLLVQDARGLRPAIAWLRQSLADDAVAGIDSEWPAVFTNGSSSSSSGSSSSSSSSSASIRAAAAASEKLSLLQLASPTRVLLLHLVCMEGEVLDPLHAMLSDPVITWVAAGWSRSEGARLARTLGGLPPPMRVLDVQAAAVAAGWHRVGLASLANEVLGGAGFVKHRKVTTSNWARPDLNERQIRYAALDALLPPMVLRQLRLFAAFPGLRCSFCRYEMHAPEGVQQRPPPPASRQQQQQQQADPSAPAPLPEGPICACEHCGRTLWPTRQLVTVPAAAAVEAEDTVAAAAPPQPQAAAASSPRATSSATGVTAVSPGSGGPRPGTSSPGPGASSPGGSGAGGGSGGLTEYLLRIAASGQQRAQRYSMAVGASRRPRQRLFSQDDGADSGLEVTDGDASDTAEQSSALQTVDEGAAAGGSSGSSSGGVGKKKKKKAVKAAAAAATRRQNGEGSAGGNGGASSASASSARQQALWDLWESGSPAAAAAVALAMAQNDTGSESGGAGGSAVDA